MSQMTSPSRSFSREETWLLREKYGVDREQIAAFEHDAAGLAEQPWVEAFRNDQKRLEQGEPLAYVIGWVSFLGAHIDLSQRPLIPRPETEHWTEELIATMPTDRPLRVLDLCCGSGCVGIAILQKRPLAHVTFVDVAERALRQTQHNLQRNAIDLTRTEVIASDLWQAVGDAQFDFIAANPPYVDQFGNYSSLLRWEPEQALFAQDEGFALINQILIHAEKHLFPGAELWLEFGEKQAKRIQNVVATDTHLQQEIRPDQFGKERVARLIRPR
jgi:release factor glutamine methyltransferase